MPTTYTDQFFLIDPESPPAAGTELDVQYLDFTDTNDNGKMQKGGTDSVDGSDIVRISVGDTITVTMNGSTVTITGVTFYLADGRALFTPTDGTRLYNDAVFESSTSSNSDGAVAITDFGPPCFAAGTRIRTRTGDVPVDAIRPGDRVETRDGGFRRVIWAGSSLRDGQGRDAPILIRAGALGNDRDLRVSPEHRVLLQGWKAEMLAGDAEVLVAAKHLIDGHVIRRDPVRRVRYVHLLLERHHLIRSEGGWSESFFPGDQILKDPDLRRQVCQAAGDPADYGPTARRTITGFEARALAA